jgi:HEAT repeat protein
MGDPGTQIVKCLEQLREPERESAWHALAEIGPVALPEVAADLRKAEDPTVRVALIRLLAEYRSPEAIPALVSQMEGAVPAIWQAALAALVTIGTAQAVAALTAARSVAAKDRTPWIDEALGQIAVNAPSAG